MPRLIKAFERMALRTEDWARTHKLSMVAGLVRTAAAGVVRRRDISELVARLLASGFPRERGAALIRAAMESSTRSLTRQEGVSLQRAILVKPFVSPQERGIVFVSFESELAKILQLRRFAALEERYQIAFLPTWQPAYSLPLFQLAALSKQPYFVMPASEVDLKLLPHELGDMCATIDLQASSWISAAHFPGSTQRDIDILLLANFSKYKRHWRLFEGLAQSRRSYRVVCAGRPWDGRSLATLKHEAELFGVSDQVQFIQDPSNQEVGELMGRARLFCAMSHKEGSFIAVAEALVSNTPVGMFADAEIGTKRYVEPATGFLFQSSMPLGPQLSSALDRCSLLSPRDWAVRELVAERSIETFNAVAKQQSMLRGCKWTTNAVPIYSRNFRFGYLNTDDRERLAEESLSLQHDFGLQLNALPVS